jgi:hypothetical protein
MDNLLPVVVGAAQSVARETDLAHALDPLTMLRQVAEQAADDAGGAAALLRSLDTICLVDAVGWHPALLGEAIGAHAKTFITAPSESSLHGPVGDPASCVYLRHWLGCRRLARIAKPS